MALTICLSFVGTSVLYALIGSVACWRISRHLKGNAIAVNAVVEHVLLPVFGRSDQAPTPAPLPTARENGEAILR
jgi:hypothetical protein